MTKESIDKFRGQQLPQYWEVIRNVRSGAEWAMAYDDESAAIEHLQLRQDSPSLRYEVVSSSASMGELYAALDLCNLCCKRIVVGEDVVFYPSGVAVHERCKVRE